MRALNFQDMNHRTTHPDVDLIWQLNRVADAAAGSAGLLGGVVNYGDTMFNYFQLGRVVDELDQLARDQPELADDARDLQRMAEKVIREAGYFWIVGD